MRRLPTRIRLRRSLAAACSFACGPLRAAGPPAPPPPDTLWLQNAGLRLGFDPRNGSLLDLTDRATGQAFVLAQGSAAAGAAAGIWRLDRLGPGDSGIGPSAARNFSWHQLAGERPGLALVWRDFRLKEAPALRVTAAVRLFGDSSLSEWRIVVDSPGAIAIEQVRFPRLAGGTRRCVCNSISSAA